MNKKLGIRLLIFTLIIILLFVGTIFLNGLYASLIFHSSIITTFGILYYKYKKVILFIPIISSLLLIDIVTIQMYLENPWWYSLLLFQ